MGQYVKYYSSLETGAPALSTTVGTAVAVFDAVLVNGFNQKSVSNITVSGNVATATVTGHSFNAYPQLDLDITFDGVTSPVELNGSKMVTVIDANTVTFPAPGVPNGNATGTITAKRSPLGWVKQFSGTNKAIYKPSDITASGCMMRIDDSVASQKDFRVIGVESATGVDTYTNPFPADAIIPGGTYWTKGNNNTTAKNWMIIGDSKMLYFLCDSSGYQATAQYSSTFALYAFGDINTYRPADAYHCLISGGPTITSASGVFATLPFPTALNNFNTGTNIALYLARDYSSLNPSTKCNVSFHSIAPGGYGVYPSPVTNGLIFHDGAYIFEENTALSNPIRGNLPGIASPLGSYAFFTGSPIFDLKETLSGEKYIHIAKLLYSGTTVTASIAFKLSNWR